MTFNSNQETVISFAKNMFFCGGKKRDANFYRNKLLNHKFLDNLICNRQKFSETRGSDGQKMKQRDDQLESIHKSMSTPELRFSKVIENNCLKSKVTIMFCKSNAQEDEFDEVLKHDCEKLNNMKKSPNFMSNSSNKFSLGKNEKEQRSQSLGNYRRKYSSKKKGGHYIND